MRDLRAKLTEVHPDVEVWAAGGVVIRDAGGELEVLLVHRPEQADWSFPKGKLDPGETLGRTAEREVREETGYRCNRLQRLPEVRYVAKGKQKLVVYWTMEILDGTFEPNDEVDALGWFDLVSAGRVLTYDRDVDLLDAIRPTQAHLRMRA
ncbi:MAG: NUDIX hydrolase [Acidimicrobiales bacterium]|nr:NUDIX hydrolase [Acidimicrobiales bacterium]